MRPLRPQQAQRPDIPKKGASGLDADALAIAFLGYLADRPDRMLRFFDLTGLTPQLLRQAVGEPDFTKSLLDYLGSDDRLLLAFAAETGRDPAEIAAVRRAILPPDDGSA